MYGGSGTWPSRSNAPQKSAQGAKRSKRSPNSPRSTTSASSVAFDVASLGLAKISDSPTPTLRPGRTSARHSHSETCSVSSTSIAPVGGCCPFRSRSLRKQSRRNHAAIVQHQQIAVLELRRQIHERRRRDIPRSRDSKAACARLTASRGGSCAINSSGRSKSKSCNQHDADSSASATAIFLAGR